MNTWVVVLVKDFDSAKQRLGPALDPAKRRALARRNATRAIRAAAAGERRLVVAGSDEAAALAVDLGAEVLVEPRQEGQNVAAQRGIGHHFGADSLSAFEREAHSRGVQFVIHRSPAMALDLDEPADLVRLHRAV